ncbi:MAG TPA: hypothetical protein VEX69_04190 [Candidatus Limnocylindria bacterium]|nr:hypothetical protein [Candidatus Limnocylindria bacterium]
MFLGTVAGVENLSPPLPSADASPAPNPGSTLVVRYHFQINERFAGPDTHEIDVFSGGDDGDCAFRFKNGEQYIVYTNKSDDGRLFATICSGTRLASEGRALLPQLRAMRNGQRVASVFGVLRRSDPPLLAPSDDPDDPLPHIKLKLRSKDDRFATSTGPDGVYTFYDVHAGEYIYTADLPARFEFTQKTLHGGLPPFRIPNGACFEYNVNALPTGKIRGSVVGPDKKPLTIASVELYRADRYDDSQPGLWGFQGSKGIFEFDHIGPGEYILVFNRMNRMDPNSPYPRSFYPGTPDRSEAKFIKLKDGQQLLKADLHVKDGYPTRPLRVQLKWPDGRPPGEVTVMAKAEQGENPAAQKLADGVYQFTLLESAQYSISAWEDLDPHRAPLRRRTGNRTAGNDGADEECVAPARLDAAPVAVAGSDADTKEITLVFVASDCTKE